MTTQTATETDAFLLLLSDPEFLRVAALLGLRARSASQLDTALVESFIDSVHPFSSSRRPLLITALPSTLPH